MPASADKDYRKVVNELMTLQSQRLDRDEDFCKLNAGKIPVVHPQLVKVFYCDGVWSAPVDSRQQPTPDRSRGISFDDILTLFPEHAKSIALTGLPGAGKTTMSKRLCRGAKTTCFYMKFQHMNYGEERMTLRELLIDKVYPHLDKETCADIYSWIVVNQKKCIIIFDGLDQAKWKLENYPNYRSDCAKQTVSQLIGSLFAKQLLPDVRLIFTTRPHKLLTIPHCLRPDVTILLRDLTDKNMKLLFYALTELRASELWNALETSSPQVLHLCHNPLMLHIVIGVLLSAHEAGFRKNWTMTKIYSIMVENLAKSEKRRGGFNVQEMKRKLAKVAYDAVQRDSVLITTDHLQEVGLDVDTVKDLVISVAGKARSPQRLFEEGQNLFFAHESLQEFFAALHLFNMSAKPDSPRLPKLVTSGRFFSQSWSLTRRFYCGLLIDSSGESANRKCFLILFER